MPLKFDPGPIFAEELNSNNVQKFKDISRAISHLEFQKKAIQLTRHKLSNNKSIIGFIGGPYTLLKYAGRQEMILLMRSVNGNANKNIKIYFIFFIRSDAT